jgi:alpha-ribazole phosphatase
MEVYLVRHTETVCEKGVCYGQSDVAIAEPYLPIFENIKQQLPANAVYYSSPLVRCKMLASYISKEVTIDSRLIEMNFGDWELKSWDEISPDDFTPWMNDFVNVVVPNGESFVQLHHRVIDFLNKVIETGSSRPVVIVAHAGVIRSILCEISGLPLKEAFNNKVDFGSVLKVEL